MKFRFVDVQKNSLIEALNEALQKHDAKLKPVIENGRYSFGVTFADENGFEGRAELEINEDGIFKEVDSKPTTRLEEFLQEQESLMNSDEELEALRNGELYLSSSDERNIIIDYLDKLILKELNKMPAS